MRVPQHVAHAIQGHIRQKKTIETRMTIRASEIKIEQMVEDFKSKRRAEQQHAQEQADLKQSKLDQEQARAAAHEWAEQCKKDHHDMMRRREQESAERNEELRLEAVAMKKAVDMARETQLEEDKTKIMLLKREFAERNAMYEKAKKKREAEEVCGRAEGRRVAGWITRPWEFGFRCGPRLSAFQCSLPGDTI
jgi:hypothetical protein